MRRREMRSSAPLFLIVFFISFFSFFNILGQSLCLYVDLLSRKRKQLLKQPKEIIEEKGKLLPEKLKKQPGCQFDFLLLNVNQLSYLSSWRQTKIAVTADVPTVRLKQQSLQYPPSCTSVPSLLKRSQLLSALITGLFS